MSFRNILWKFFILNGTEKRLSHYEFKRTVMLNSFLISITLGYFIATLFFLIFLKETTPTFFVIESIGFSLLVFVGFLIKMRKRKLANLIFIIGFNLILFVNDNYLGHQIGVFVYYIDFLFIVINIYSLKEDRNTRVMLLLLPVFLFLLTELYTYDHTTKIAFQENGVRFLFSMNVFLSMLLILILTNNHIRLNAKAEESLDKTRLNLQTLIDNTNGNIWSINTDYKITAGNDRYKQAMKQVYDVDVAPGFDIKKIFAHPKYPIEWVQHYERALSGEVFTLQHAYHGWFNEVQGAPIRTAKNEIVGAAFYSVDITERKQNELNLLDAKQKAEQASNAKAAFLSNMSHELRTPLNGIIGLTNIMLNEPHSNEQQKTLDNLKYSSDHMLSLIDNILDFNKIDAGKLEIEAVEFNLHTTLMKLVKFFDGIVEQKELQFTINIDPSLNMRVSADITRLRQVLTNIISNAIKFTHKGFIQFDVHIKERNADQQIIVAFEVKDSGIGIAKDKIDLIFQSFTQADIRTTRKYGGSGLGLTISKSLVDMMNGKMLVSSELNVGTSFIVELPFAISNNKVEEEVEKRISDFENLAGVQILVAEDNKVNMLVVRSLLQKWGAKVDMVENGFEAIRLVKENVYDLILMDLEMPVMDGPTAVTNIRKTQTDIPIIALTAAFYENMQADLVSKKFNGYVQKPYRPEDLHSQIVKQLAAKEAHVKLAV
jgi:signal transduction histidine kinase/ActR/RegA family two-component response regulator